MKRVLFYVQHLLGLGHLKRAEILAGAMAAQDLAVTVALGGRPLPDAPFAGAEVIELPPAAVADDDFSRLLDRAGQPIDDAWRLRRRAALLDCFRRCNPDVLLIELFPFGRRQFRFELLPLLQLARERTPRPQIACSVRDILVARKPGRDAEILDLLRRYFDAVLVHGDPDLIGFGRTFPAEPQIRDLIRYTGYVAGAPPAPDGSGEGAGEVLVSAGGGAVGAPLLSAALAARAQTPLADRVWRFVTGPNLASDLFQTFLAHADSRTCVERFRTDFRARLSSAALSISQAGYNTVMDILRSGVPAVVVPFETRTETEQRLRAEVLAEKGVLTVVPEAELSPERLAAAISLALTPSPRTARIDLSGAATTARLVRRLADCVPDAAAHG